MARLGPFLSALGLLTVLGAVLRGVHLGIPMRYDESVTYLSYVSPGWIAAFTGYDTPNNHVFHSLLVVWATDLWGSAPHVIRLPAYLAGCALVPASAWVATKLFDRETALVTAALVATSPILIEYSANARGHGMVALFAVTAVGVACSLLHRATWAGWLVLALLGMGGIFTVPTMLLPWIGVSLWLATVRFRSATGVRARAGSLVPVVGTNLLVAAYVALLYAAVIRGNGWEAFLNHRFVQPQDWPVFAASLPSGLAAIGAQWMRGTPLPLLLAVVAGLVAVALRPSRGNARSLAYSLVIASVVVMLLRRNLGEARVWLWALPLVLVYAGAGLVWLTEWARSALGKADSLLGMAHARHAPLLAASWGLVMSLVVLLAKPVWKSEETGTFPQGPEVAAYLIENSRGGDQVLTDFVTEMPLRYYLNRLGFYSIANTVQPRWQRVWVVVHRDGGARERRVVARLRRLGGPPLIGVPVFESGSAAIYLLERAEGG